MPVTKITAHNSASRQNIYMSHTYPSLTRIQAHLEELRLQEKDALEILSRPEAKPGTHTQLRALLRRIREERQGLERSAAELLGSSELISGRVN
jgi:hypothetical protein